MQVDKVIELNRGHFTTGCTEADHHHKRLRYLLGYHPLCTHRTGQLRHGLTDPILGIDLGNIRIGTRCESDNQGHIA